MKLGLKLTYKNNNPSDLEANEIKCLEVASIIIPSRQNQVCNILKTICKWMEKVRYIWSFRSNYTNGLNKIESIKNLLLFILTHSFKESKSKNHFIHLNPNFDTIFTLLQYKAACFFHSSSHYFLYTPTKFIPPNNCEKPFNKDIVKI